MIVATAGHVDHGKTSLVRALTGIDTDRLPEEKLRGLTIDLGFAHHELAGGTPVSFIDVPGHKRFIHNMLAGVAAIDLALLVIAADDGIMPQTEEHLAILDLLGVTTGLVVLSKIDRVDPQRRAEVRAAIAALLAPTGLAGAEVLAVSALTGEGLPELAARLEACAARCARHRPAGQFRLAVDRAFNVAGAGIVVTGTVFSGRVAPGDELVLSPQGRAVRVRGLQTRERDATQAEAGERCALNLAGAGLALGDIRRGDWIQAGDLQRPTRRLDTRLRVLATETAALAHWTPVQVHLAAARRGGRIALLENTTLAPGQTGLAQLLLDEPLCAVAGDRFIVRDPAAQRTIGGGVVIDPFSPARGRARAERLAEIRAMERRPLVAALNAFAAASAAGVDVETFRCAVNLTTVEMRELVAQAEVAVAGKLVFSPDRWTAACAEVERTVDQHQAAHSEVLGIDTAALLKTLTTSVRPVVAQAVLATLLAAGALVKTGTLIHRPGHVARPSPEDEKLWRIVEPRMRASGLRPPLVREVAAELRIDHGELEKFLGRMTRFGRTMKVAPNRFFLTTTVAALGHVTEALGRERGADGFTAREFRDASGIGRNLTIEVLEFFDRLGLTRRSGDQRFLVRTIEDIISTPSERQQ